MKLNKKVVKSWLNTTHVIADTLGLDKPCHKLGYCPYGQLVEEFPISKKPTKLSCKIFGHNCPAFYHAENITE